MDAKERVKKMLNEGKISQEQADKLLSALDYRTTYQRLLLSFNNEKRASWQDNIYKKWLYMSGIPLLGYVIVAILLAPLFLLVDTWFLIKGYRAKRVIYNLDKKEASISSNGISRFQLFFFILVALVVLAVLFLLLYLLLLKVFIK